MDEHVFHRAMGIVALIAVALFAAIAHGDEPAAPTIEPAPAESPETTGDEPAAEESPAETAAEPTESTAPTDTEAAEPAAQAEEKPETPAETPTTPTTTPSGADVTAEASVIKRNELIAEIDARYAPRTADSPATAAPKADPVSPLAIGVTLGVGFFVLIAATFLVLRPQ